MAEEIFQISLYLPAQGSAETEATIVAWCVAEGDTFRREQKLAEIDSAKSVFDFQAPCDGRVIRLLASQGDAVSYEEPVIEIETADPAMREWIPPAASAPDPKIREPLPLADLPRRPEAASASLLGLGAYLPERIVTNEELVESFPDFTAEYVYQVTGVRKRHWAAEEEKPSDMALAASRAAIADAGISLGQIDAIVLATTTPDVAMPSTACILQQRLGLRPGAAFDLNAACSGWLYAVSMARGMIGQGIARNVLAVGVDVQSRLLDRKDHSTCFLFGDGAGAAIISADSSGHKIAPAILAADSHGLRFARRDEPGYIVANGSAKVDPWIRMDGPAIFRMATDGFATVIERAAAAAGWQLDEIRYVVPHQANARILKAAAKRCRLPFERFYLNVDRVGNTSSASIPLALVEIEQSLASGDKLILCSVGAGVTMASMTVHW